MSQKEQLNEMKQFMAIAEGKERPYICVHAKKGKHECSADSSYGAAQKAAKAWGLKSTAGIDAHLADIKHSTQFVGEDEDEPYFGQEEEAAYDALRDSLSKEQILEWMQDYDLVGPAAKIDDAVYDWFLTKYVDDGVEHFDGEDWHNWLTDFVADNRAITERSGVKHDSYGATPVYEDDPDSMGSYDISWNGDTWKEALPYDVAEKEVQRMLQMIDDSALQAHDNNDHLKAKKTAEGDTMVWTVLDPADGDYQEIRVSPSDMPAGYTGESIELGDIVENVLQEYPGQPKDYDEGDYDPDEADQREMADDMNNDYEQDVIDPEIEDEELGLRFD